MAVHDRRRSPVTDIDPPAQPARADLVRRLFDAKAAAWPAKYATGGALVSRLASLGGAVACQVSPGGRVIDLGCGTGELVRWLAGLGFRVIGCDISGEMLRTAAAGPTVSVDWLRLDPAWQQLPFKDHCVDAVVASSVLEYTADAADVLAECARVLRPGGFVVCTVPDLRHPVRWLEWLCLPLTRVTGISARKARWCRYGSYLRASGQRHQHRWWLAAADRAGLRPEPLPDGRRPVRPLRVLNLRFRVAPMAPDAPAQPGQPP